MQTQLSTKLLALIVAVVMNTLMLTSVAVLFAGSNAQAHQSEASLPHAIAHTAMVLA